MADYDYDLFVIGAGSGGVRAARLAALMGKRVAVAEEDRVGGTCVIRGCVPKKLMVYASEFSHLMAQAESYGWSKPESRFDWTKFLEAKEVEIGRLSGAYASNIAKSGAELIHAKARLTGPHTIELVGKHRTVTADIILIATGGRVSVPANVPGIEHVITSNEAFHLERLPKSIVVVGGGYIAVEFAGIFNGLGVDTTLVYRGPNILRGFDEDVRSHLSDEIERRGIKLMVGTQHVGIDKTEAGLVSRLDNGVTLTTDQVMFATGRAPYVEGLGLESAGVALTESGAIAVDDYSRTNAPNIYAVGDVTDRINLTPVAIREAAAFAATVFGGKPTRFDHELVPTAVFSQPPVGCVGMTEGEARRTRQRVDIYTTRFRPMKEAFAGGAERVLMKLVVDGATDVILGCHIVGPESPEMIQLAAVAIKMGVTKADWDNTCALHPTMAEELVTMREKVAPIQMSAAE
ncbi:MAG TPA: glutathione-disulfide reductase [Caulobacteraceae bacterium]|nr:glutathione-disulfide reductase [Caulobacteraceae bacterium]